MNELAIAAFSLIVLWALSRRFRRSGLPLPPGPKPWPILDSMFDMPTVRPWETYRHWCQTYNSDVIYLHLPIQPTIILGSAKAAMELLDKRSHLYSDRVRSIMFELMTWDFNLAFMQYTARWRAHRRMFHQHFYQAIVNKYRPIQIQQVRAFLSWVLKSPEDTRKNVRLMVTSAILRVAYGKKVSGMNDEFVLLAQKAVEGGSLAAIPGAHWVEYLPILKYIPSWVPGAASQKLVAEYLPSVVAMRERPYDEIKVAAASGVAPPSLATTLVEQVQTKYEGTKDESVYDEIAKNVVGLAYAAGADTTTSAGESLLAMATFPDVQKKAQAELDRVVGQNRLPDYDDLADLPYIRATIMETLRWMPVLPFSIPHRVIADDIYEGYHIPKGTVVIPNTWAMLHDPEDYPEPELFKPDRFIGEGGNTDPNIRDPVTMAFVLGDGMHYLISGHTQCSLSLEIRSICIGRHFSNNTLSIFIASTLHVFDISAGIDEFGQPVKLSTEMHGGLIAIPRDVPCGLKPRSPTAERLIREAALELEA